MNTPLAIQFKRFKQLREELQLTQSAFAKALGISASTADIERGKTKLTGAVVMELLRLYHVNPLWIYGKSFTKYLDPSGGDVLPKVISLNDHQAENILLVNQRAAAGYPQNIGDPQWYEQLPAFSIPLPEYRNATYRGFQVEGDSMMPNIRPNDWVLGRAVPSIVEATDRSIYIVVLNDSVLVKKLEKLKEPAKVRLVSLNQDYLPIDVAVNAIQELWQVNSKISFGLEDTTNSGLLQQLKQSMEDLKGQITNLSADE